MSALVWLFVVTLATGEVQVKHYTTERACEWGRALLAAETPLLDASPCGPLTIVLELGVDPRFIKASPPSRTPIPGPR